MKKKTRVLWNVWTHNVSNHLGKTLVAKDTEKYMLKLQNGKYVLIKISTQQVAYTADDTNMCYYLNLRGLKIF